MRQNTVLQFITRIISQLNNQQTNSKLCLSLSVSPISPDLPKTNLNTTHKTLISQNFLPDLLDESKNQ